MKLLFIGDIVARPGRELVSRRLRALTRASNVDLVIANAENAAAGCGITREIASGLFRDGVDVLTMGNHVWDQRETLVFIGEQPRLLRPANYPPGAPGSGRVVVRTAHGVPVGVVNVMGRVFMTPIDDPFAVARREIARLREEGARLIVVDMHAEATSEKMALGWMLAGEVTAVIGTHTHVQTADERILPGGTAYITDVGMTGPSDGIIGMEKSAVIARFTTGLPSRFETATGDPRLHAVVVTADEATGRATGIERLALTAEDLDAMAVRGERDVPVSSRS